MSVYFNETEADNAVISNLLKELNRRQTMSKVVIGTDGVIYKLNNYEVLSLEELQEYVNCKREELYSLKVALDVTAADNTPVEDVVAAPPTPEEQPQPAPEQPAEVPTEAPVAPEQTVPTEPVAAEAAPAPTEQVVAADQVEQPQPVVLQ